MFVLGVTLISSCATSMTPSKVSSILPQMTKAKFYSQVEAQEAIRTNGCKILVKDRKYLAPMGTSLTADLRNGAVGIDDWVNIDGAMLIY